MATAALALVLGMGLLLAASANAATNIGDVAVTVDPFPNGIGSSATEHGYVDYRVRIKNNSKTKAHRVTLWLPKKSYGSGDRIRTISRTVSVEPEATEVVSLFQLPLNMSGYAMSASVAGVGRKDLERVNIIEHAQHQSHYFSSGNNNAFVLAGQSVDAEFRRQASRRGSRPSDVNVLESQLNVALWSSDWLSYTTYDGLVVTAKEMGDMPAPVKRAIRRYVEAGGSLTVLGPWQPDADWFTVPDRGDKNQLYLGFGELRVGESTDPRQVDFGRLSAMWERTASPQRNVRSVEAANTGFPVVDDLGVPVRGLLLLMVVFAVVIGPVNLWVLAKKRRRMWLLWTVPVISLFFCVAVWGYALFAEGITGKERTEGVTYLDERNATATTLGMTAFYSPLTPGGGLRFDRITELTPQLRSTSWRDSGRGRTIDWTDDQHLRNGWVVARVPAHFRLRKSDPTQRLNVNPTVVDGKLTAVNSLGDDVTSITIADHEGNLYEAGPTLAGQPFVLTRTGRRAGGEANALRQMFSRDWPVDVVNSVASARRRDGYLRPNSYIAILESNPFIESGLGDTETRKARAVVYGVFDPPANDRAPEP